MRRTPTRTPDACRTNCKLAHCGDGVIDLFEDCEGKNLGDIKSCQDLGYDGGVLKCDPVYCEYDEDGCIEGRLKRAPEPFAATGASRAVASSPPLAPPRACSRPSCRLRARVPRSRDRSATS